MSNVNGIWLPNNHTWRDLWLARNNVADEMRQSTPKWQYQMHQIDLLNMIVGQERRTTCEGVQFYPLDVTSNINCGAIHNAQATMWWSLRFKLNINYSAASATSLHLMAKVLAGTDRLRLRLTAGSGVLTFSSDTGGAPDFSIVSTETTWAAGVWHHVLASISAAEGVRMIIDGGTPVTDADLSPAPNGGDLVIGDYTDGSANSFDGVISRVFVGIDDLTTEEETNLNLGIPPADATEVYLLNEGQESTAYDEGSGGNDGTLDTTATWAWGGCRQPVIGFAGIDQWGRSPLYQKGNGDLTMVWVGRLKSPYLGLAAAKPYCVFSTIYIDADNRLDLYYDQGNNEIRGLLEGTATTVIATGFTSPFSYNDYAVFMLTSGFDGSIRLYANGSLVSYISGAGSIPGANGRFNLQSSSGGANYNVSDVLACGVINGVVDTNEVREITKRVDAQLNMGVTLL